MKEKTLAVTLKAIVHFRTAPNGAYKWMVGKTRGHWRTLVVTDPMGSVNKRSKNVIEVLYDGPDGLNGVGHASKYNLSESYSQAYDLARDYNGGENPVVR